MKKYLLFFGMVIAIAVAASFFASSLPDGLESALTKLHLTKI